MPTEPEGRRVLRILPWQRLAALLYLVWLDMQKSLFLEEVGCGAVGFLALPGAGVMRRGGGTSRGHAESVTVQRGRRNSHTCIKGTGRKKADFRAL